MTLGDNVAAGVSKVENQQPSAEDESATFDRAYVQKLRDEAAAARVRAKRADDATERLRALAVQFAVRDVLKDADDLPWSDDFADEEGWPDQRKIVAAAEALVAARPYLGRVRGEVGMGQHSEESDDISLVGILAAGA